MHSERPGLQPERTSLAWQRTALAAAALGVAMLKAWTANRTIVDVIASCLYLSAAILMYSARHPDRRCLVAQPSSARRRLIGAAIGCLACSNLLLLLATIRLHN